MEDAAGPQRRAAEAPIDGVGAGDGADVPGAFEHDLAEGEEAVGLVDGAADAVERAADAGDETVGQVLGHAADADVAVHHARAADALEELLDLLTLAEAVHERRAEDADVGAESPVEEHVTGDAVQLAENDADQLRAFRRLDAHQLLGGQAEDELVVEVGHVVEPVEQRDDLPVVLSLAELLGAPVQIADDGLGVDDALALNGEDHAEDAVRAGVLRPHVEQHVDAFEAVVGGGIVDRCAGGGGDGGVGGHRVRSSRASSSRGVSQRGDSSSAHSAVSSKG